MSEPKSLRELQEEWREHATRMRACCKRSAEYRSLGTRQEMAAIARDYDGFADQLSPHIECEERQSAYIKQLEAVVEAAKIMVSAYAVDKSESYKLAAADKLSTAISRLSADKGDTK